MFYHTKHFLLPLHCEFFSREKVSVHCIEKAFETNSASFSKTAVDKKFLTFSENLNEISSNVSHLPNVLWFKEPAIVIEDCCF